MEKNKIILSSAAYKPLKGKEIERDADGYYKVRLGAFNIFNAQGAFYSDKGVEEILKGKDSIFYRRLSQGFLRGEMGHPPMKPGMTKAQFIYRSSIIDMENVAFHIKRVELEDTDEKVEKMGMAGNVKIVVGWIMPAGPKGKFLQEALDNPECNVAFSVRSISSDRILPNGTIFKETKFITTWDWVIEPGIQLANTFDMLNNRVLNREGYSESFGCEIKLEDLNQVEATSKHDVAEGAINQESADSVMAMSNIIKQEIIVPRRARSTMLSW